MGLFIKGEDRQEVVTKWNNLDGGDTAWIDILPGAMLNNWSLSGLSDPSMPNTGFFYPLGYRVRAGMVEWRGCVASGAASVGNQVLTLPEAARPEADVLLAIGSQKIVATIAMLTVFSQPGGNDMTIDLGENTGASFCFDGVSYAIAH